MKHSRHWLVAIAPALGLAAVVGPGLGAHATTASTSTRCDDDGARTSTTSTSLSKSDDRRTAAEHLRVPAGAASPEDSPQARASCRTGQHDGGSDDSGAGDDDSSAGATGSSPPSSAGGASSGPTTSVTSAPTTTSSTSSTSSTPTTSTTSAPRSPLAVAEQFTQLANGQPMLLGLTVTNTSAAAQTFDMTVEVKGGSSLPPYLNVNSDGTQKRLSNWSCTPNEIQNPTTDNVFSCLGVVIPGNTINVVMVTTGSRFAASGDTISVTATVTQDNGSTANLPAAVTASATVA